MVLSSGNVREFVADPPNTPSPDRVPLTEAPPVLSRVQSIVSSVNKQLAPFEQVKRFKILPREFSTAEGEVTPTLKLRRKVILDHFAAEVDALYDGG